MINPSGLLPFFKWTKNDSRNSTFFVTVLKLITKLQEPNTFNAFDTFNAFNVLKTTKIVVDSLAHSESQLPKFQYIYFSTFSAKLTVERLRFVSSYLKNVTCISGNKSIFLFGLRRSWENRHTVTKHKLQLIAIHFFSYSILFTYIYKQLEL